MTTQVYGKETTALLVIDPYNDFEGVVRFGQKLEVDAQAISR
ncbi:hypothetical protein SAZ10_21220 [Mesorhizobium sp. BAC0120]|nr:hypothetical protein [Mesorhizobium sp. BAC0120]MDW6024275.1 hypothetical protein [Mesorhizobium sp. BAC0120]